MVVCFNRILELERFRDERLYIQSTFAHEVEDSGEDMCVTENSLNSDFLHLSRNHIERDRLTGMADKHNSATRSDAVEDLSSGSGVTCGLEEVVATPPHCLLVDSLSQVLGRDVNRDNVSGSLVGSDSELGSRNVRDVNSTGSSSEDRHRGHTSDGTSSLDDASCSRSDLGLGGGVHSDGNGLSHGSLI